MLFLLNFKLIKSFRNSFISIAIGVTTKKNIIPITIGEIIFPKSRPNLNHILFKGFNNFEFKRPKTKKIIEITKDQILMFSLLNNGYKEIIKKTIKNTTPKLI